MEVSWKAFLSKKVHNQALLLLADIKWSKSKTIFCSLLCPMMRTLPITIINLTISIIWCIFCILFDDHFFLLRYGTLLSHFKTAIRNP